MKTTAKNDKYNNCTSECIELNACMELSLKLEREKAFLEFLGRKDVITKTFSLFFSFMEKHLIVFYSQSLGQGKQNPNDLHNDVKSETEMWFFWVVVAGVPVLVALSLFWPPWIGR